MTCAPRSTFICTSPLGRRLDQCSSHAQLPGRQGKRTCRALDVKVHDVAAVEEVEGLRHIQRNLRTVVVPAHVPSLRRGRGKGECALAVQRVALQHVTVQQAQGYAGSRAQPVTWAVKGWYILACKEGPVEPVHVPSLPAGKARPWSKPAQLPAEPSTGAKQARHRRRPGSPNSP